MTDQTDSKSKECLSAMVDNEAFELELFRTTKALSEDQELRDTWHRYHLVSSIMRKETTEVSKDLSGQIASAIALETELLVSPVSNSDDNVVLAAKGASNDSNGISSSNRGLQKFAVAASVAIAVVIGVQQLQPGSGDVFNNGTDNVANVTAANVTTTENNILNIDRPAVTGPQFQLPSGYVLPRVNLQTVSTSTSQPARNGIDSGHMRRDFSGDETDQQIQNYLNYMLLKHAEQGFLRNAPLPE